jgi:hypothetical protein
MILRDELVKAAGTEAFRLFVSSYFFSSCVWLKKYFPQLFFDFML